MDSDQATRVRQAPARVVLREAPVLRTPGSICENRSGRSSKKFPGAPESGDSLSRRARKQISSPASAGGNHSRKVSQQWQRLRQQW
jgi:hypothetical protein